MSAKIDIIEVTKIAIRSDSDLYRKMVDRIDKALQNTTIVWEYWEYSEAAKRIADELLK